MFLCDLLFFCSFFLSQVRLEHFISSDFGALQIWYIIIIISFLLFDIGDIVHKFENEVKKADRIAIGKRIKQAAEQFPRLLLDATVHPLSKTLLRIRLKITPDFTWNDRLNGYRTTNWWIWVENSSADVMYYHEFFSISKQQVDI